MIRPFNLIMRTRPRGFWAFVFKIAAYVWIVQAIFGLLVGTIIGIKMGLQINGII